MEKEKPIKKEIEYFYTPLGEVLEVGMQRIISPEMQMVTTKILRDLHEGLPENIPFIRGSVVRGFIGGPSLSARSIFDNANNYLSKIDPKYFENHDKWRQTLVRFNELQDADIRFIADFQAGDFDELLETSLDGISEEASDKGVVISHKTVDLLMPKTVVNGSERPKRTVHKIRLTQQSAGDLLLDLAIIPSREFDYDRRVHWSATYFDSLYTGELLFGNPEEIQVKFPKRHQYSTSKNHVPFYGMPSSFTNSLRVWSHRSLWGDPVYVDNLVRAGSKVDKYEDYQAEAQSYLLSMACFDLETFLEYISYNYLPPIDAPHTLSLFREMERKFVAPSDLYAAAGIQIPPDGSLNTRPIVGFPEFQNIELGRLDINSIMEIQNRDNVNPIEALRRILKKTGVLSRFSQREALLNLLTPIHQT